MLIILAGCAAQDAHRTYARVETKLSKASSQGEPNDPAFREANQALVLGRAQLLAGRYDLATRTFREVDRLTDRGLEDLAAAKKEAALAEQRAKEEKAKESREAEAAQLAEAATAAAAAEGPEASAGEVKSIDHLVAEIAKPGEAGDTHITSPPKTSSKSQHVAAKPKASSTPSSVIVAPAAAEQKKPPRLEDEKSGAAAKETAPEKRRSVGSVTFVVKDASIIDESMAVLNQTAKYLLDNPSRSLILEGSYSPDEAKSIVDQRLESVKAYLVGKGVPEDQILFDEQKKRGSAEVLLFEIVD